MISERLKSELTELKSKVLEIREFTPESFQCVCDSLRNLQAVLFELCHDVEAQQAMNKVAHTTVDVGHLQDGKETAASETRMSAA